MGGGDSGGGSQSQNTSSTQQTGPSPVIAPKLESIGNDFWSWYGQNANAPGFYPGSTTAALDPKTNAGLEQMYSTAYDGLSRRQPVRDEVNRTATGAYTDVSTNPYWQAALKAGLKPQTEAFNRDVIPGLDSRFAGAGRYASGAHFDQTGAAVDSLNRSQADASAKAAADVYGAERTRQIQAASLLPSFQQMDYQDIASMLGAGAGYETQAQKGIDEKIARYNYGNNAQPEYMTRIAQMLQSIYPGGQTWGTGTGTGTGGSGSGSSQGTQLAGAGIMAAGTVAAAFL